MSDVHAGGRFQMGSGSVELKDGDTIISAMARFGGEQQELKMIVRGHELKVDPPAMGDALLPMALIAAMTRGLTLEMADTVSPQLLEATEQIQRIMHMWYPYLSRVDVEAPVCSSQNLTGPGRPGRRAHFFSGGVDSLHSAFVGASTLDALVFVAGSDMIDCTPELQLETTRRLTEIAAQFELPLIYVDSNVREWATACGRHNDDFIGARLAIVAHLLGEQFDEWVIAPTILGQIDPFFSHPMIDPLWSSERVSILHPVPDRNRAQKTWDLAQADGYLENLRICMWGEEFNCGVCRKCMRTLLTLKVLGIADRAPVFTRSPDIPELLEKLSEATRFELQLECQFLRETIEMAREIKVEKSLIDQLVRTFDIMEGRREWERMESSGDEAFLQSDWSGVPFERRRACFRKLLAENPEWLAKELAADLTGQKEAAFASLWKSEHRWLKGRVRRESFRRLARKLGLLS